MFVNGALHVLEILVLCVALLRHLSLQEAAARERTSNRARWLWGFQTFI